LSEGTVTLTPEAQQALDFIGNIWAPIMRHRRVDKIRRIASLLMTERDLKQADKKLVVEAARMVLTPGYQPFLDQVERMAVFQKNQREAYVDDASYYAKPRAIVRWPNQTQKPEKPPAEQKLLAFQASPRIHGNTDVILDEAIRGARDAGVKDIEKFYLQKMKLKFCIGCRKCKEPNHSGYCPVKDDMEALYPKIVEADALIFGFPIYTGRECAQLSTFLDRFDCFEGFLFGKRLQKGRRSMVIGTWGYAGLDTYDHTMEQIMTILNLHHLDPVEALSCSGFAGKYHGWDQEGKAIVLRYPEELKKAYQAGKTLASGIREE
jgi:multimeric flavodoxin WrbA